MEKIATFCVVVFISPKAPDSKCWSFYQPLAFAHKMVIFIQAREGFAKPRMKIKQNNRKVSKVFKWMTTFDPINKTFAIHLFLRALDPVCLSQQILQLFINFQKLKPCDMVWNKVAENICRAPQTVGGGWVYFDYRKSMKKCHHGLTMLQRFLDNKKLLLSFPYNSIGHSRIWYSSRTFLRNTSKWKVESIKGHMVPTCSQPMT